jgi:2-succinyl-6-hydroxy-2,4-cyclohexadiene-1-carboxylate synthase
MGSGTDFASVAEGLAERTGRTVLCPDLPGHGGSRPVWPESLERAADAVLESVDGVPFDLLGYSLGGRVALALTARHPDAVRSLILESAHPGIPDIRRRAHRLAADRKASRVLASCHSTTAFRAFLESWYRSDVFAPDGDPPLDTEERIAARLDQDPAMLARAMMAFSTGIQPDWSALAQARVTGYICGARDRKYVEIAHEVFRGGERERVRIVEEAGHTVHRDAPEAYLDLVCSLLHQAHSNTPCPQ